MEKRERTGSVAQVSQNGPNLYLKLSSDGGAGLFQTTFLGVNVAAFFDGHSIHVDLKSMSGNGYDYAWSVSASPGEEIVLIANFKPEYPASMPDFGKLAREIREVSGCIGNPNCQEYTLRQSLGFVATELEKHIDREGEEYVAEAAIDDRKSNPHQD